MPGPEQFISEELRTLVADSKARGKAKGKAEGTTAGTAGAVLTVLAVRRVKVPEPARQEFLACTDTDQLSDWLTRAATASTITDVTGRPRRRWPRLRRPGK